jgi:hypothetical protein
MNKTFKSFISVLFASLILVSCGKEQPEVIEYLDVNANNISGSWELVDWNGYALQEGTYVFINLVRNDRIYTMYQNIDSFGDIPHVITGRYFIETDPAVGAVIRGDYDHDSGDWAHRYIVKDMTATSMTWVAKDNPEYIQKYERVESIPVE